MLEIDRKGKGLNTISTIHSFMTIKNELAWSSSRIWIFNECLRKYYYHYYGAWNGWDSKADADQKELYLLKRLESLPLLLGGKLHETIFFILDSLAKGQQISMTQAENHFKRVFGEAIKISSEGVYKKYPKLTGLDRHEYNINIPEEEIEAALKQGVECINNFLASDLLADIKSIPVKDWIFCPPYNFFMHNGMKIWAVFDFAYKIGRITKIIEFKTGKNRNVERTPQVDTYGFYFVKEKGVNPEDLKLLKYHLFSDKTDEYLFTEEAVSHANKKIAQDYTHMTTLLSDKANNVAEVNNFPKTSNPQTCRYCKFRRYCDTTK